MTGLYIKGCVNSEEVVLTVDTGVSVSLLAKYIYDCLFEKPELDNGNTKLKSASGEDIQSYGRGIFQVVLGAITLDKTLLVADITDDVLLGADVLLNDTLGRADLLLSESVMILDGVEIPLEIRPPRIAKPVKVKRNCQLPPITECVIDVEVEGELAQLRRCDWLIEPLQILAEKHLVVMAPTLVQVSEKPTVQIRVMNPFPWQIKLYRNCVIGEASKVEDLHTIIEQEDEQETGNCASIRRIQFQEPSIDSQTNSESKKTKVNVPEHMESLFSDTLEHIQDADQIDCIARLFNRYSDIFSKSDTDLGLTNLTEHVIITGNAIPIKQAPRRVPLAFVGEDQAAVENLKAQGTIRESTSPWASPLVFVRKRNGQVRPCVDYRKLNNVTLKDAFPLPRTQDCLDSVAGSKLFSSMDITSAYNQIPVRERDNLKTAFVSKYGLFEFTTMPFGLSNAPATFQRVMELALAGLQWKTCLVYLDDVLVFSRDFDTHISRLSEVLDRICEARLKLKPKKMSFFERRGSLPWTCGVRK